MSHRQQLWNRLSVCVVCATLYSGYSVRAQCVGPPGYEATPIISPDNEFLFAFDVNDLGEVCGAFFPAGGGPLRPFLWDDGEFIDLSDIAINPGDTVKATSINNVGEMLGVINDATNSPEPGLFWIWTDSNDDRQVDGGEVSYFGAPQGSETDSLSARDLNDLGNFVGTYDTVDKPNDLFFEEGFLWAGVFHLIEPVDGEGEELESVTPTAINLSNVTAVEAKDGNFDDVALRWSVNSAMLLEPCEGSSGEVRARGINDSNHIVGGCGFGFGSDDKPAIFLAQSDYGLTPGSHLIDSDFGRALDLTKDGWIVGTRDELGATLWIADGVGGFPAHDLNELADLPDGTLTTASRINRQLMILARDNSNNYFLLQSDDSDGDGLLDTWETCGIDINVDGVVDLDLAAMGADPDHKDLFVEIDAMTDRAPDPSAIANVIQAFDESPVEGNPDGDTGITLHAMIDETDLPLQPFPNAFAEFDALKEDHFGTPDERSDPNWPNIKLAKDLAFRYCIFADTYGGTGSSGLAELPGNDFMVTLGAWSTPGGTLDQQAGTFMHEFGHTLDLRHGGGDNINRKPNYYSVMNYMWQLPQTQYPSYWRLDYSHVELDSLNECLLIEGDGIDGSDPDLAAIMTLINPGTDPPADACVGNDPPVPTWVDADGSPVDWNGNGMEDTEGTSSDVNYHYAGVDSHTLGSPLIGHDDWSNLRYQIGGHPNFADGVHTSTTLDTEMTAEIFLAQDKLTPAPPAVCVADLDGDTNVGVGDLLELLSAWGECPQCPADLNGDGIVDVADLLEMLSAWGPCN